MTVHDERGSAQTLADIAHALEGVENVAGRVRRVLTLVGTMIPYARCAFYDVTTQDAMVVPETDAGEMARLRTSLQRLFRLMTDASEESTKGANVNLTLPVTGVDEIVGVIHLQPPIGFSYDVTHLKLLSVVAAQLGSYLTMLRLRAEEAHHSAQLTASNNFMQALAGIVGHDLRSPLAVILAAAEALQQTNDNPEREQMLDLVLRSAERATRMISDLVDVTQARVQGVLSVRMRKCDARKLVSEIVNEARVLHRDRDIRLTGGARAIPVSWDADRIGQLITNLINNAVHHGTPAAPIDVAIREDPAMITLTVHNEGPIISEAQRVSIFDPFARGPDSAPTREHGLGLGLYIVAQIAKAHGGEASVVSDTGGTTFQIELAKQP